jgi:hypothetical protein
MRQQIKTNKLTPLIDVILMDLSPWNIQLMLFEFKKHVMHDRFKTKKFLIKRQQHSTVILHAEKCPEQLKSKHYCANVS